MNSHELVGGRTPAAGGHHIRMALEGKTPVSSLDLGGAGGRGHAERVVEGGGVRGRGGGGDGGGASVRAVGRGGVSGADIEGADRRGGRWRERCSGGAARRNDEAGEELGGGERHDVGSG